MPCSQGPDDRNALSQGRSHGSGTAAGDRGPALRLKIWPVGAVNRHERRDCRRSAACPPRSTRPLSSASISNPGLHVIASPAPRADGPQFEAGIFQRHVQLAFWRRVVPDQLEARRLGHRVAGQGDRLAVERPIALGFLVDRSVRKCVAEMAVALELERRPPFPSGAFRTSCELAEVGVRSAAAPRRSAVPRTRSCSVPSVARRACTNPRNRTAPDTACVIRVR